jgi:hypothetical protein
MMSRFSIATDDLLIDAFVDWAVTAAMAGAS